MRHKTALSQIAGQHRSQSTKSEGTQHAPSATALRFNIDRITMEGYSAGEQKRFIQALQSNLAELARSIGGNQWSAVRRLALDRLDAGRLPHDATPEIAARQIATRIRGGLTKTQGTTRIARQQEEEGHA